MIGQRRLAVPKTAKGEVRVVYDPATGRRVPDEGVVVTVTPFWARRAKAGDVSLAPVPKPIVQAKSQKSEGTADADVEDVDESDAPAKTGKKKPRARGGGEA